MGLQKKYIRRTPAYDNGRPGIIGIIHPIIPIIPSTTAIISIIFAIFFIIGIARSAPKNEYTDFEHGSSDWSQNGEQYQVLSKNKGIILAEGNYLPVDKRGNVNVLVVGRFRFW